jgi:leucyl aminopeptidase (aminopeptidase T)
MEKMQAYIAVRGSHNITESSDVPDDKMALAMKKLRPVQNHRGNKTKWCVLRWPNPSMAQQAQMSTEAFENFYFDVCLLDYAALVPAMKRLEELMSNTDEVHITGPGTDLKFNMRVLQRAREGQRRGGAELQHADALPGDRVRQHAPRVREGQDRQCRGQQQRGLQPNPGQRRGRALHR